MGLSGFFFLHISLINSQNKRRAVASGCKPVSFTSASVVCRKSMSSRPGRDLRHGETVESFHYNDIQQVIIQEIWTSISQGTRRQTQILQGNHEWKHYRVVVEDFFCVCVCVKRHRKVRVTYKQTQNTHTHSSLSAVAVMKTTLGCRPWNGERLERIRTLQSTNLIIFSQRFSQRGFIFIQSNTPQLLTEYLNRVLARDKEKRVHSSFPLLNRMCLPFSQDGCLHE